MIADTNATLVLLAIPLLVGGIGGAAGIIAFFRWSLGQSTIKTLKENPQAGPKVPRPLWPRIYIKSYGIDNLHKMDLPDGWRLTYTLKGSQVEVVSVILEWFDHKEYARRFGYKIG